MWINKILWSKVLVNIEENLPFWMLNLNFIETLLSNK